MSDFKQALFDEFNRIGLVMPTQNEVLASLMAECTQKRIIQHIITVVIAANNNVNAMIGCTLSDGSEGINFDCLICAKIYPLIDYDEIYYILKKHIQTIVPTGYEIRHIIYKRKDGDRFAIKIEPLQSDIPTLKQRRNWPNDISKRLRD